MRISLLPFAVLCFFISPAKGQTSAGGESQRSGSFNFYLVSGLHAFNFSHLNQEIEPSSFPAVKMNQQSSGFGVFGTFDKVVMGLEGYDLSSEEKNDSGTCSLQGGMGMFYFGYKFLSKPHFSIYPIAGIGLGGAEVKLQKPQEDVAFKNFLLSPLNAAEIGIGSSLFNLSLVLEYRIREQNTIQIGLRTGYNFSGSSPWKARNFYFVDAPRDNFSSYYGLLSLGISIGN